MQGYDDAALDFLDSLVIFDRICPFAIEHLPPAMSRRVFNVGLDMDMGRIRNGLRSNKEKRSKSFRATDEIDHQEGGPEDAPDASDQNAMVPRVMHKKSDPTNDRPNQEHQRSDPLDLPSPNNAEPNIYLDFPLPPSQRTTSDWPNVERTSRYSQLNPDQGNLDDTLRPDDVRHQSQGDQIFDLKPPPPNSKVKHIDTLSERLFSGEHLKVILKDPTFFLRFTAFLNRYKPQSALVLVRYLEAQKAVKAVEYANALAEMMKLPPREQQGPFAAASIDPGFEANLNQSFDTLVDDALPAYITTCLTKVVTESMVREITGYGMPVMRELVGGLAEVFCLADPSIEDCPIVYASEEFYRTTRYSRDDVVGRNCRFLQGPKTNRKTIARLGSATRAGQESCETILNYRRDGLPFMNLLLTAPLYDNRGSVRYFIGAQIDVSGLIEDGKGLDSFARLLTESRRYRESDLSDDSFAQKHLRILNEFGQMLSLDETSAFQNHSRASSMADSNISYKDRQPPSRHDPSRRHPRRILGNDEEEQAGFKGSITVSSSLSSGGKLPGVYQNYLLVRSHPSLRIIFVSPALRIPGLLQSPFLSRIGGPAHVREGLANAFEQGAAVTAKVTWLPKGNMEDSDGMSNGADSRPSSWKGHSAAGGEARTRYISCTPLLGSDDQVGVWMVVMVENELVTGSLASREHALARHHGDVPIPRTPSEYEHENPEKAGHTPSTYSHSGVRRSDKIGSEGGRLYAEFMRGTNNGETKQNGQNQGVGNTSGNPFAAAEGRIEEVVTPMVEKPEP